MVSGYLPHYKAFGSYNVPKVDVQLGLTFTSKPGLQVSFAGTPTGNGGTLQANYSVSNAQVMQSLGRPLSGNASNVTVNLIEPGTKARRPDQRARPAGGQDAEVRSHAHHAERGHLQLDERRADPELQRGLHPGGAWLLPTSIMTARFARLNVQVDF